MKISTGLRSRAAGFIEKATRTGLKFGIPVAALGLAYLLYVMFVMTFRVTGVDLVYLTDTVEFARGMLRWGCIVVVASLSLRFVYEPLVGQLLAAVGGILYFYGPAILGYLTDDIYGKITMYQGIVGDVVFVGLIALIPGVVLVVRDLQARVQRGLAMRRFSDVAWGDEEQRARRRRKRKLYEKCWDMQYCRDFVRKVCPAWHKRKPCWRIKCGCYCDEHVILAAMTSGAVESHHGKAILQSLEADRRMRQELTPGQKRARCRRCTVYAEHQRQKYQIASALAFPFVVLVFWLYYAPIAAWAWSVMEKADRFLSFLTYRSVKSYVPVNEHIMTALAVLWLAFMALNYTIRAIEYWIFDLQL